MFLRIKKLITVVSPLFFLLVSILESLGVNPTPAKLTIVNQTTDYLVSVDRLNITTHEGSYFTHKEESAPPKLQSIKPGASSTLILDLYDYLSYVRYRERSTEGRDTINSSVQLSISKQGSSETTKATLVLANNATVQFPGGVVAKAIFGPVMTVTGAGNAKVDYNDISIEFTQAQKAS